MIVKPNDYNNELLNTGVLHSKHFTKRDTVKLWTSKPVQDLISSFIRKLILTQLYYYNLRYKIEKYTKTI